MDEAPSCAKVKGNKLQWNAMAYFVGSERVRKNRVDAIDHYQSILEAYESTRIVSYHCNKFSKEELKAFKTSVKRFRDKLEAKLKIAHTATGNR
jgi:argininosuccinate lyase